MEIPKFDNISEIAEIINNVPVEPGLFNVITIPLSIFLLAIMVMVFFAWAADKNIRIRYKEDQKRMCVMGTILLAIFGILMTFMLSGINIITKGCYENQKERYNIVKQHLVIYKEKNGDINQDNNDDYIESLNNFIKSKNNNQFYNKINE